MSRPPALALPPNVLVGTCSFTAPSWSGPFYPRGLPDDERLAYYAGRFPAVEIDATWYGPPRPQAIQSWRERTPEGFRIAAKVPRLVTHDQCLLDCGTDMALFIELMEGLGEKLGPLLLQFPYFNQAAFPTVDAFLERLEPFLSALPREIEWAVEVRNRSWLGPRLFEALRRQGAALAWIDYPGMPLAQYYRQFEEATTADWVYLRLLGNREGIERLTQTWDAPVYDRSRHLTQWAETLGDALKRVSRVYVFANNHYAGCGYHTAEQLSRHLAGRGVEPTG